MYFDEKMVARVCSILESRHPGKDCSFYKFGLAIEVLRILVGGEWVNQAVFPNDHPIRTKATQNAMEYLRSTETGYQFQERVYRLAARLYEIQSISNVARVVDSIKTGDLDAGYAEIEVGDHLKRRDIPFHFVLPQGAKGLDFDIEIEASGIVNCEVKHKLEGTLLTKETLEKTLSAAKSQVPQDVPAIFFVKIPEEWVRKKEIMTVISRTLGSFFPRSTQVMGVMFRWEERGPGAGIFYWKYRLERNPHFAATVETTSFLDCLNMVPTRASKLDQLVHIHIQACRSLSAV